MDSDDEGSKGITQTSPNLVFPGERMSFKGGKPNGDILDSQMKRKETQRIMLFDHPIISKELESTHSTLYM